MSKADHVFHRPLAARTRKGEAVACLGTAPASRKSGARNGSGTPTAASTLVSRAAPCKAASVLGAAGERPAPAQALRAALGSTHQPAAAGRSRRDGGVARAEPASLHGWPCIGMVMLDSESVSDSGLGRARAEGTGAALGPALTREAARQARRERGRVLLLYCVSGRLR